MTHMEKKKDFAEKAITEKSRNVECMRLRP